MDQGAEGSSSNWCIEIEQASVVLGGFPALANLDFNALEGDFVLVAGPNGAGKSTLLRLLAGLRNPVCSSANVLGHDLTDPQQRRSLKSRVGLMEHQPNLYSDLTVSENIRLWTQLARSDSDLCIEVAGQVGLGTATLKQQTRDLSHGQRRKLSFALLAAKRPELWLLDEPLSGLDKQSQTVVSDIIGSAKDAGATIVFASHDSNALSEHKPREVQLVNGSIAASVKFPAPEISEVEDV